MNKEDRVHMINIGLMGLSLVAAFILPFEVFLFAYAVLGPLHYLTEINWLDNKNYFIKKKKQVWLLVLFTILLCLPLFYKLFFQDASLPVSGTLLYFLQKHFGSILFACFVAACGLVYFKHPFYVILLILITGVFIWKLNPSYSFYLMTAVMMPTLIHVYLFTLIFMVYGVVKSGNRIGIAEVLCLCLAPFLIAYWPLNTYLYQPGSYAISGFNESNFKAIHIGIGKILGIRELYQKDAFIHSELIIRVQIFIAFAYLYHYLNWFSKVSVIGWLRNTSLNKIILLVLLWAISVGIYWYDYKTGLNALFFLSLLHVILEFPLNIVSLKVVFSSFINRILHLTKLKQLP